MRTSLGLVLCLAALCLGGAAAIGWRVRTMRFRGNSALKSSSASSGLKYGCLQHCGVLVSDVDRSKEFYMNVFDFSDESHLRPTTLPYPGAFLNIAGNFQIHLMQLPSMDPKDGRPEHGGRDRHIAVTVNNIDIIKDRLSSRGLPFTMSQSGRRALFCRDPDGNAYEFMETADL
jgi:glyoxylase I family protein